MSGEKKSKENPVNSDKNCKCGCPAGCSCGCIQGGECKCCQDAEFSDQGCACENCECCQAGKCGCSENCECCKSGACCCGENCQCCSPGAKSSKEDELKNALSAAEDKYMRLLSDYENQRRRAAKEKEDARRFGLESFLTEFLPVLDSFGRVLSFEETSADPKKSLESFQEGISLVYKQLLNILQNQGVKSVDSVGKPFDPAMHQAVARTEIVGLTGERVEEEYSKGYLLHDRLLRAAMVKVGVPAELRP